LSEDLPVVIEIIDHPDRLAPLLAFLDESITEGMITKEPVHVIVYRHSQKI